MACLPLSNGDLSRSTFAHLTWNPCWGKMIFRNPRLPFIKNSSQKQPKCCKPAEQFGQPQYYTDMDDKNLADVWEAPFSRLVSVRDCLIYITHFCTVYPTPAKLAETFRNSSFPGADYMHIFWECPHTQAYWTEVLQVIQSINTIPLRTSVKLSRWAGSH